MKDFGDDTIRTGRLTRREPARCGHQLFHGKRGEGGGWSEVGNGDQIKLEEGGKMPRPGS